LGDLIKFVTVGLADHQDVQICGGTPLLPHVAGCPGTEEIGGLDAVEFGECFREHLAWAERTKQQLS
jgi:hypothetical protein